MTQSSARYHHGDLRRQLVEAATQVVREQGTEALRVRSLATSLDVTHPAAYAHFRDRDALLAAVLTEAYERLSIRIATSQGATGPISKLIAIAVAYMDFARREQGIFLAMIGPRLNARNDQPALEEALQKAWTMIGDIFAEFEMTSLPLGTGTAVAYWSALQGLAAQVVLGRVRIADERIERFTADFALALLRGFELKPLP